MKTWPLFRIGLGIAIQEQELGVQLVKEDKITTLPLLVTRQLLLCFMQMYISKQKMKQKLRLAVKLPIFK